MEAVESDTCLLSFDELMRMILDWSWPGKIKNIEIEFIPEKEWQISIYVETRCYFGSIWYKGCDTKEDALFYAYLQLISGHINFYSG